MTERQKTAFRRLIAGCERFSADLSGLSQKRRKLFEYFVVYGLSQRKKKGGDVYTPNQTPSLTLRSDSGFCKAD